MAALGSVALLRAQPALAVVEGAAAAPYPMLYPGHINCRCTITPEMEWAHTGNL